MEGGRRTWTKDAVAEIVAGANRCLEREKLEHDLYIQYYSRKSTIVGDGVRKEWV